LTCEQLTKIVCKNSKRGKWGPKPSKFGPLLCAPPQHQTKCGPITEYFHVEGRTGIEINCDNNKCSTLCPKGKFSTLPEKRSTIVCRNSRRNIWNLPKTTRVACVSARKLENSESLKCGTLADFYSWYANSKVVARCSGLRRKMEKCDLRCEDGSTPRGITQVFCNRKTQQFEPAKPKVPIC